MVLHFESQVDTLLIGSGYWYGFIHVIGLFIVGTVLLPMCMVIDYAKSSLPWFGLKWLGLGINTWLRKHHGLCQNSKMQ